MLSAAQLAGIGATVASSLDQTVTIQRRTPTSDGYGHTSEVWSTVSMLVCNVIRPSATQLQAYASIIGTQAALVLRFMPGSIIAEGDSVIIADYVLTALGPPVLYGLGNNYQSGRRWLVNSIQSSDSYSVSLRAIITLIE